MRNVDTYRYQAAQGKKNRADVNVASMVEVLKFYPKNMTVDVQPLSKYLDSGEWRTPPPILGALVATFTLGGFIMRPWINKGDIGFVIYADHDVDFIWQTGKAQIPNTERNHSPNDAIFIGGITTQNNVIPNLADNAFVIATQDNTVSFAISQTGISIKGNLTVDGNINANGVNANGISLGGHVHGGVYSGGSLTGQPQ